MILAAPVQMVIASMGMWEEYVIECWTAVEFWQYTANTHILLPEREYYGRLVTLAERCAIASNVVKPQKYKRESALFSANCSHCAVIEAVRLRDLLSAVGLLAGRC